MCVIGQDTNFNNLAIYLTILVTCIRLMKAAQASHTLVRIVPKHLSKHSKSEGPTEILKTISKQFEDCDLKKDT